MIDVKIQLARDDFFFIRERNDQLEFIIQNLGASYSVSLDDEAIDVVEGAIIAKLEGHDFVHREGDVS